MFVIKALHIIRRFLSHTVLTAQVLQQKTQVTWQIFNEKKIYYLFFWKKIFRIASLWDIGE